MNFPKRITEFLSHQQKNRHHKKIAELSKEEEKYHDIGVIYHYTTITGLIGIITNQELWSSDCIFLNDGKELTYAKELFNIELEKLGLDKIKTEKNCVPLSDQDPGGYPKPNYINDFKVFITCFCEEGDLLSQWRGYGVDQGYAIGFEVEKLKSYNIGDLAPIQYGLTNPTSYFAKDLEFASEPTAHLGTTEWHTSMWILPRLARVKHPGFKEEKEWRLINQFSVSELNYREEKLRFRSSPLGPIGYLVIPLPPDCVKEIIIGPGNQSNIRKEAIISLLRYYELHEIEVKISSIPLRW